MMYRNPSGTTTDRTIVVKDSLGKGEFVRLLEAIRGANPNIKIDADLFPKSYRDALHSTA